MCIILKEKNPKALAKYNDYNLLTPYYVRKIRMAYLLVTLVRKPSSVIIAKK